MMVHGIIGALIGAAAFPLVWLALWWLQWGGQLLERL